MYNIQQPPISSEEGKSWQTSHLPKLNDQESQAILDIMHAWFHQKDYHAPPSYNWGVLWEYLDRHGLSGLTGSLCLDDLGHFPPEIEELANQRYFTNVLYYEQVKNCLSQVQAAARNLAIPTIVLKGPALIFQGYGDPGTRSFSDIDVFIDSLDSFYLLQKQLDATLSKDTLQHSWLGKMGESDCASFFLEGWEHEFRFPLDPPAEPMYDILLGNSETLQIIPKNRDDIINPDPSIHLVFLIQHMAVHHLFSRFFWFLDLAVLVRHNSDRMDFDRVERELDRIGQTNAAAVASEFCRKHIDPSFPVFKTKLPAWNFSILKSLAEPKSIADGRYGVYHKKIWDRFLAYFFAMMSFYFVEDPKKPFYTIGFGTYWTMYRMKNSMGIKPVHPLGNIIMGNLIRIFTYPLARLIGLFTKLRR